MRSQKGRGRRARLFAATLIMFVLYTGVGRSYAARGPTEPRHDARSLLASRTADTVGEPAPLRTPQAPGISIGAVRSMDLPDPFLLPFHGTYYLYLSTAFGDRSESNIPLFVGTAGEWHQLPDALPTLPGWSEPAAEGGLIWAPDVVEIAGTFVMYYSAPDVSEYYEPTFGPVHCIGVAVSSSPAGPFVPRSGPPIVCQPALGGDIDPQFFTDYDGPDGPSRPYYLVWKSDDNNLLESEPTGVWGQGLANDGLSVTGEPTEVFRPDKAWEKPIVEAPQMVLAPDGSDWLFFSGGAGFFSADYGIGVVACAGPLGPCHEVRSTPLISSNRQGSGPGEETVFSAADGSTWLLYSPWHTGTPAVYRPIEAARIGWDHSGPYVAEAGSFPPPPAVRIVDTGRTPL